VHTTVPQNALILRTRLALEAYMLSDFALVLSFFLVRVGVPLSVTLLVGRWIARRLDANP
jgi:hypothetical protein